MIPRRHGLQNQGAALNGSSLGIVEIDHSSLQVCRSDSYLSWQLSQSKLNIWIRTWSGRKGTFPSLVTRQFRFDSVVPRREFHLEVGHASSLSVNNDRGTGRWSLNL